MADQKIPLSRPDITELEIDRVLEVLASPYLSLGPRLPEFEEKVARYVGAKYTIAVNSGTSGLHLSLLSLNLAENDAVITTPFSFIASSNCILYVGATPVFVDIDPVTFNIDPAKIEEYIRLNCFRDGVTGFLIDRTTQKRVRAILPVHVFGHPCDMTAIMSLAARYHLHVVEDACEALGASYGGKKVGTIGDVGVFAFYPNKQITTGEGGMVVTNDDKIANTCRSLRNHGRQEGGGLVHFRIGYNYRISEIQCALGCAQMDRIEKILKRRAQVAEQYNSELQFCVETPMTTRGIEKSWFAYVVCLPQAYTSLERDEVLEQLAERGIGCSNYFPLITSQPLYRERFGCRPGDFPIAESISERTLALPFHNRLDEHEVGYVADSLREILSDLMVYQRLGKISANSFEYNISDEAWGEWR